VIDGLRVVLQALNDVRRQGYVYIWANLAFVALSLPVVTMPAALVALFTVSHHAQTEARGADLDLFWETFKAHVWKALPWGLAMAAFGFVVASNLISYAPYNGPVIQILRVGWMLGAVVWMGLLLYTWPLYLEMAEPDVWGASRNAVVMLLRNPFFSLVIMACVVLLSAISTVLIAAWLVLTWGALGAIGSAAVIDRVAVVRSVRRENAFNS